MAPRLTHALVLEAPQDVPDGAGGMTRNWVALGTLWAAVRPGAGGERTGPETAIARQSLTVTVRAGAPGAPSRPRAEQRFRHGTRVWRILSVGEPVDGYIACRAVEEVAQ